MKLAILPNLTATTSPNRALALSDLLSSYGQHVTLLVAEYVPDLRRELTQRATRAVVWSVFDELQAAHDLPVVPRQIGDFNWPAGAEFIETGDDVLVYVVQRLVAKVQRANGVVTEIHHFLAEQTERLLVDDRGFVGQVICEKNDVPQEKLTLNVAGDVVASEPLVGEHAGQITLATLIDGQQRFANLAHLQSVLLENWLAQQDDVKLIAEPSSVARKLAPAVVLADEKVAWAAKTVTPAEIWPFVVDLVDNDSLLLPEVTVVWRLGDLSAEMARAVLWMLLDLGVRQGNLLVRVVGEAAGDLEALVAEFVVERVQTGVLAEQIATLSQRFTFMAQLDWAAILPHTRVVVDLSAARELAFEQALLASAVPQIRLHETPLLRNGENGLVVTEPSQVGEMVSLYATDIDFWRETYRQGRALAEDYTAAKLYEQWQTELKD
ncbi:MAG TPA: accessory Sec system glycosyltransferase Asp1 [Lactobacillaceae bacterium]|jgi:hypothetical protein